MRPVQHRGLLAVLTVRFIESGLSEDRWFGPTTPAAAPLPPAIGGSDDQ